MAGAYQPLPSCSDEARQPEGGDFKAFKDEYYRQLGKHYDPEAASEAWTRCYQQLEVVVSLSSSLAAGCSYKDLRNRLQAPPGNPRSEEETAIAREYLHVVQTRNELFDNMFQASLLDTPEKDSWHAKSLRIWRIPKMMWKAQYPIMRIEPLLRELLRRHG